MLTLPGSADLTVTALNEYVRRALAGDPMLRDVYVRGEISNFTRQASGHLYFTLKDADAAIRCAMFRQHAMSLRFAPRDGMRVRVFGSVGLYVKNGQYQLYAEGMRADGEGELNARFLALKDRLSREGLFDAARKRPLPLLPRVVGVVTSPTGAVLHDIRRVLSRRNPAVSLLLCPALVQGEGAAASVAHALDRLSARSDVDVIIVGRGGGSLEDLWAFNEEAVARAIARCAKPVISAVGHETDVTIADFAADVRAATPSAAAELVAPERGELLDLIEALRTRAVRAAEGAVREQAYQLRGLILRMDRFLPNARLDAIAHGLALLRARMRAAAERRVMVCASQSAALRAALETHAPDAALDATAQRMALLNARMNAVAARALDACAARARQAQARLAALSPYAVLARGYAMLLHGRQPVEGIAGLRVGDTVRALLADGEATLTVDAVRPNAPRTTT